MQDFLRPDTLGAMALVPEQLYSYVRPVSGLSFEAWMGFAAYSGADSAVLIGYPDASGLDAFLADPDAFKSRLAAAVSAYTAEKKPNMLTVLAPVELELELKGFKRGEAQHDLYQSVALPFFSPQGVAPVQKLRNMLNRAGRELEIGKEAWSDDCAGLVAAMISSRPFSPGTRHIFGRIRDYLGESGGARLFAARNKANGRLEGFCAGDFTPLGTALYLFAFRRADAVPGTADFLLAALVREAQDSGYDRVNLGLAINAGIGFFKKKWGAQDFLPYVEIAWQQERKRSFFSSLFR